ncbi:MAG: helix-turn-helix transcriptional regulator [Bacteroidales bacterium]|nr:helix-turn-helix transcriptional regulator [Bacteroidales bacterium]
MKIIMAKAIDVLKANKSNMPSKWKEQAQWHVNNWDWLKHSTRIALKAKKRLAELGLTQKELAEKMGCSQQYVSLIFQGKENLTLETIAKLEKVLNFDIIEYKSNNYKEPCVSEKRQSVYLNEPKSPAYKLRKKEAHP